MYYSFIVWVENIALGPYLHIDVFFYKYTQKSKRCHLKEEEIVEKLSQPSNNKKYFKRGEKNVNLILKMMIAH